MSRKKSDVSLKTIIERYSMEEQVEMYNVLQQNFKKIPCNRISYVCKECSHADSEKLETVLSGYLKEKYKKFTCVWSMDTTSSGTIVFKEEVSLKFINDLFSYEKFSNLFKLVEIDYEEQNKYIYIIIRKL